MNNQHKRKFTMKNTLNEKIEITLKVTEKSGNVTFATMCSHVRRFLNAFPDGIDIKEK